MQSLIYLCSFNSIGHDIDSTYDSTTKSKQLCRIGIAAEHTNNLETIWPNLLLSTAFGHDTDRANAILLYASETRISTKANQNHL